MEYRLKYFAVLKGQGYTNKTKSVNAFLFIGGIDHFYSVNFSFSLGGSGLIHSNSWAFRGQNLNHVRFFCNCGWITYIYWKYMTITFGVNSIPHGVNTLG